MTEEHIVQSGTKWVARGTVVALRDSEVCDVLSIANIIMLSYIEHFHQSLVSTYEDNIKLKVKERMKL